MTTSISRPVRTILTVGLVISLQPAAVLAAGASGAATSDRKVLRVTALDRAGQPKLVDAVAVNVATKREYYIPAGGSVRVDKGTYAVGTVIGPAADSVTYDQTVAARSVTVQSDSTVTFDARQGRRIPVGISDDATPMDRGLILQTVLAGDGMMPTSVSPDAAYLIPDPSQHVGISAHAVLSYPTNAGAVRYDLTRESRAGLPANLSLTNSRAQLARVEMRTRTLDPGQNVQFLLTPKVSFKQAHSGWVAPTTLPGPGTLLSYRTPGTTWGMDLRYLGGLNPVSFSRTEPARPAGASVQTWGGAVWGPHGPAIPPAVLGRRLTILLGSPLCRAQSISDRTRCEMSGTKGSVKLYRGSTLLAKYPKPNSKFGVSVPIAPGSALYRLMVRVDRKPGAQLARAMTGSWVFRASGTTKLSHPKLAMPRLEVAGLNQSNAAVAGSTTAISVSVAGWKKATGLVVEASPDGGKTWKKAAARGAGKNKWTASVRNPAGTGFVTLRVRGQDSTGQSFTVTYRNAYRLG